MYILGSKRHAATFFTLLSWVVLACAQVGSAFELPRVDFFKKNFSLPTFPRSFPKVFDTINFPLDHPLIRLFDLGWQVSLPRPGNTLLCTKKGVIFPPLLLSGQSPESISRISILNGNLWLLPFVPVDQDSRLEELGKFLGNLRPDILLFQEVWVYKYLRILREFLPQYWCVVPEISMHNRTGLVIFSRFPPSDAQYGHFGPAWCLNFEEFLGNKGFLSMKLKVGEGVIKFCSTHLNAPGNDPADRNFTDLQFLALKRLFRDEPGWVFCGGDLNTRPDRITGLNEGFFTFEENLSVPSQPKPKKNRIDYFFWKPDGDLKYQVESTVLSEPVVSDHLLLLATITLPILR